jgi:hypothetical protein
MSTAKESAPDRPARPARCHVLATLPGYPTRTAASNPPTSIPSSRALVDTTPTSSPENNARSISRRSSGR